jgi:hypothetical protein
MIWRCQKNKFEELCVRKFPAQDVFRATLSWKFRSDEKVYYVDDALRFPYYDITSTNEYVMKDEYYNKDIEFYTDSEKILRCYNQLKASILKAFE